MQLPSSVYILQIPYRQIYHSPNGRDKRKKVKSHKSFPARGEEMVLEERLERNAARLIGELVRPLTIITIVMPLAWWGIGLVNKRFGH